MSCIGAHKLCVRPHRAPLLSLINSFDSFLLSSRIILHSLNMTKYISSKKEEYTLQKGYEKGEIIILSDYKAAWRVDKRTLSSAR